MALKIYSYDPFLKIYQEVSSGTDISPVVFKHDGFRGEEVQKKLFVRNDSASNFYLNVQITPISVSTDISSGDSILAKLYAGELAPTDWDEIDTANTIDIADIGSISAGDTAYKPFWFYIFVPKGMKVQTIQDISLSLSFSEGIVS